MSNSIENRMANLAKATASIHGHFKISSNHTNSVLYWYSPQKDQYQCHLLGKKVSGNTFTQSLESAEKYCVQIYNKVFGVKNSKIEQCLSNEDPTKWSKSKLLEQFLLLTVNSSDKKPTKKKQPSKNSGQTITIVKKRSPRLKTSPYSPSTQVHKNLLGAKITTIDI